ncbi:hydroxyectoine utilization dehydratase EutB [soil metagenome]
MLNDIKAAAARIRGRVLRTPLRYSRWLSSASGGDVFLKIETIQPTYSYKIRGATNAVMKLVEGTATGEARPIVTASAGNHGRAMAHAAGAAGLKLTVYVAETAPQSKIEAMREAGAELKLCADYDEAERRAKKHAATGAAIYISPYAHRDVIAGAGTVGLEILEEDPAIDTIVAAIGGGGLISGVAAAAQGQARTIGAEVAASTPFTRSLAAGRIVTIEVGDTIADGLSGNLDPDSPTFDLVRSLVDRVVVVEEQEVIAAMRGTVLAERLIIEGATGVAVAAVQTGRVDLRGRRVAVVISGANIDSATLKAIL